MGVIVSNPRYERLAQCLAAGMRQADICRELDYSDTRVSDLTRLDIIRNRLAELLEQHAQKSINTGAIADQNERKSFLTRVVRSKAVSLPNPGHQIAAVKELNLMEGVYKLGGSEQPPVVSLTYVFQSAPEPLPSQVVEGEATILLPEVPT